MDSGICISTRLRQNKSRKKFHPRRNEILWYNVYASERYSTCRYTVLVPAGTVACWQNLGTALFRKIGSTSVGDRR